MRYSDPEIKRRIRIAAEREEHENYGGRMPDEWLRALEPLGTDEHKPFLEIAPWLVVLFRQNYGLGPDGEHVRHYYVSESVGIAAGLLAGDPGAGKDSHGSRPAARLRKHRMSHRPSPATRLRRGRQLRGGARAGNMQDFDGVRGDPRLQNLLRRMSFPAAGATS